MAPGQHPNAHPGAGMVQAVHPGVSAPGGPQVSQGGPMMAGMPPGAGTTGPGGPVQAHALSHLGPAQAHMFQQPHFAQQFAGNPQLLHQQQQQAFMRQRLILQQQQQQQQHQQQHGGLPVSLPNGNPAGLTAAHVAAMQANQGVRPVNMQMQMQQMPHGQAQNIQQQQQHLFAIQAAQAQQAQHVQQAQHAQQAQQAQQAQAQQAHQAQQVQQAATPVQPGQQTPQQRAAAQPQSVHDAQSATPQPQPGPPPHQGSATPQPNPSQIPTTQPPQPQQQPPAPQPQPTPNPPPQQLPQSQQPGPQQQPPQQPQPQPQPPQSQQGPVQGQQQPPMMSQEAQLKAAQQQQQQQQQQQNPATMMMQQQPRIPMKGAAILHLNSFAEHLSSFQSRGEAHDLAYWQQFVGRFYAPGGVLRQGVYNHQTGSKQFEIGTVALPRYYYTQFTSGIRHIQMVVEGARERDLPNGGHIVESPRTSFIYWFTNDTQLFANGTMTAHFDMNNKIEMLDIVMLNHTEYLPRSQLQALEQAAAELPKQSPKVTKNAGKRGQQKQPPPPAATLPESMVTLNGVPGAVMQFMEVSETIASMQFLMQFSQQNPQLTPWESLRNLVNSMQNQVPNPAFMPLQMNPAMQQGQPRAPSMNAPNQFASPAMAHLGLPPAQGSPHLSVSGHPSPAPTHLAGPPMPQGQVQGNGPQVTSASASPNVGTKRRRASTVKVENDDNGPDLNGAPGPAPAKVKASPRVGAKKQKGGA
ncbi:hypothetical protein BP00DRAFT_442833 [Aspergillus indologenus CBS 114.80]|uniref:LIM-domain binding protein n=1 Tax=Aspergillus indologenus CBS 114.80 TaxID=1450541 RepID=A0A2V5IF51_9EURO|nr:hypothetical protein BP00DRAFT_442833 [Aspergillus indologenus CBS 114.80]